MEILKYGNPENDKIILIHGFESPYQIWEDYIEFYQKDYCVIVPILTGHNIHQTEDFVSFDRCAKELEDYYIEHFGNKVYAIYGMSMGGVLASFIWKNKRLQIKNLILESSPLLSYGSFMTFVLTKQYLYMTHKAQQGDAKIIKQAVNSMITEDKLDLFLELLVHISDKTIINYIKEIGKFKLPHQIDAPSTHVTYYYGGKTNEMIFRNVAKFIKKNYKNATVICLHGKGHCEDSLLNPQKRIQDLNKVFKPLRGDAIKTHEKT